MPCLHNESWICAQCGGISAIPAGRCLHCGTDTRCTALHAAASGLELDYDPKHSGARDRVARSLSDTKAARPGAKAHAEVSAVPTGDAIQADEFVDEFATKPRVLLAATDFSAHSYRALRRAAALSRQWGAKLVLLHVVQQGKADLSGAIDVASVRLNQDALDLTSLANSTPEFIVRSGSVVTGIAAVAEEMRADLVILGKRRRRAVRDLLVDPTTARVLRVARTPVLLVNRSSIDPYGRILIATDLSRASSRAVQFADTLNLLDEASVSVLHAFSPFAKAKLIYAGARPEVIAAHVKQTARNALDEVVSTLRREGLNLSRHHVILADDHPQNAIRRTVKSRGSELLVIGTRGHRGLKRALLGSTVGEVLRTVNCDVLAVPPYVRVSARVTPVLERRDGSRDLSIMRAEAKARDGQDSSGSGYVSWIGRRNALSDQIIDER